MKKLILYASMITLFFISSCDKNDDVSTGGPDGFTVNGGFYSTENCYVVHESKSNKEGYYFIFLNGRVIDNNPQVTSLSDDPALISKSTTRGGKVIINSDKNPSLASSFPSQGNTYISSESEFVYNAIIESLNPPFIHTDGREYGENFDKSNPNHVEYENDPSATANPQPTITINSIDIADPNNATIDVDYTFVDEITGHIVTGHYDGTIGVFKK